MDTFRTHFATQRFINEVCFLVEAHLQREPRARRHTLKDCSGQGHDSRMSIRTRVRDGRAKAETTVRFQPRQPISVVQQRANTSQRETCAQKSLPFCPIHEKPIAPYQLSHGQLDYCRYRFQLPAGVTADQIRAAFDEAAPDSATCPV